MLAQTATLRLVMLKKRLWNSCSFARCCSYLVHNSSGLARTVLLAEPQMPYANVHLENSSWVDILSEPVLEKSEAPI